MQKAAAHLGVRLLALLKILSRRNRKKTVTSEVQRVPSFNSYPYL